MGSLLFRPVKAWILSILCFALLPVACEYQPDEIYRVDVKPVTEAPPLEVKLNIASDTLYLPLNIEARLQCVTSDPMVRFAELYLNDTRIGLTYNTDGFSLPFNTAGYQTNTPYSLRVLFFRSSGSGSLADKMHVEGFMYERTYVVFFMQGSGLAPRILSAVNDHGNLKITWEKYMGFGFIQYHLMGGPKGKVGAFSAETTSSYDYSYFGQGAVYYLLTETSAGTLYSQYVQVEPDLPKIGISAMDDRKITLHWNQTHYPTHIRELRIFEMLGSYGLKTEIASIHDFTDTTYTFDNMRFGVSSRFIMQIVPKDSTILYHDEGSYTEDVDTGLPFYLSNGFARSDKKDLFMDAGYNRYLYRYNTETHQMEDSLMHFCPASTCSPDGKYILSQNLDDMVLINADNLSIEETMTAGDFPSENMLPLRALIGNTGKGFLMFYDSCYFYDFKNHTYLKGFTISGLPDVATRMEISPDGTFYAVRSWENMKNVAYLYHYDGSQVSRVWSDTVNYFSFDNQGNQFVYDQNGQLKTLSLDGQLQTGEIAAYEAGTILDIDWYRREVLLLNNDGDNYLIYNLDNGLKLAEVRTYGSRPTFLIGKALFTYFRMLHLDY